MTAPAPTISPELRSLLRRVKLGKLLDTLPERLALAKVVIMGAVGVGKTFLATALRHAAVRRRYRVHFERTDHLLCRLKASRLDNSLDAESASWSASTC